MGFDFVCVSLPSVLWADRDCCLEPSSSTSFFHPKPVRAASVLPVFLGGQETGLLYSPRASLFLRAYICRPFHLDTRMTSVPFASTSGRLLGCYQTFSAPSPELRSTIHLTALNRTKVFCQLNSIQRTFHNFPYKLVQGTQHSMPPRYGYHST